MPTPGTAFAGTGNTATDNASLLGKGAADTLARMRNKALGKLDRPVSEIQGVLQVPLWDNSVGSPTAPSRAEAPRLRGAVTPGQQGFPWLETGCRLGYKIESLSRGGQPLGLTKQRLSPQAIADQSLKAHFAYNRRSDFEKNGRRRVVPFHTFTSRNIPLHMLPRLAKRCLRGAFTSPTRPAPFCLSIRVEYASNGEPGLSRSSQQRGER